MCQQPRVLCHTLKKEKRFYYSVCEQENTIYTYANENDPPGPSDPMFPFNIIDETIGILWNQFKESPFPLANSADRVPAGEADNGLGTAYHQASKRGAPEIFATLIAPAMVINTLYPLYIRATHEGHLCRQ